MSRKMMGRPSASSHKMKRKQEETLKPETYRGYIISFIKKSLPVKVGNRFIERPIEWRVQSYGWGIEEIKEDALKEAKKFIDKNIREGFLKER